MQPSPRVNGTRSLAELSMPLMAVKAWWACRDASRASVLEAAGIQQPRALAVVYTARARLVSTVHSLRDHFPKVTACSVALLFTAAAYASAAHEGVHCVCYI